VETKLQKEDCSKNAMEFNEVSFRGTAAGTGERGTTLPASRLQSEDVKDVSFSIYYQKKISILTSFLL
jgi:hypothetical protein